MLVRLEDLQVWEMEKVKEVRKGSNPNTYGMASWPGKAIGCKMCTWGAA